MFLYLLKIVIFNLQKNNSSRGDSKSHVSFEQKLIERAWPQVLFKRTTALVATQSHTSLSSRSSSREHGHKFCSKEQQLSWRLKVTRLFRAEAHRESMATSFVQKNNSSLGDSKSHVSFEQKLIERAWPQVLFKRTTALVATQSHTSRSSKSSSREHGHKFCSKEQQLSWRLKVTRLFRAEAHRESMATSFVQKNNSSRGDSKSHVSFEQKLIERAWPQVLFKRTTVLVATQSHTSRSSKSSSREHGHKFCSKEQQLSWRLKVTRLFRAEAHRESMATSFVQKNNSSRGDSKSHVSFEQKLIERAWPQVLSKRTTALVETQSHTSRSSKSSSREHGHKFCSKEQQLSWRLKVTRLVRAKAHRESMATSFVQNNNYSM